VKRFGVYFSLEKFFFQLHVFFFVQFFFLLLPLVLHFFFLYGQLFGLQHFVMLLI
jgi:hypothetical protein